MRNVELFLIYRKYSTGSESENGVSPIFELPRQIVPQWYCCAALSPFCPCSWSVRMRYVLSIQSSVAHGHVGNSAAAFALQRLGQDIMRIDTVRFSNHPAHGGFAGGPAPATEIAMLVDGLSERGFLKECRAVLSGYLGTAENGKAVAHAVNAVRAATRDSIFLCDPVMGDDPKGLFVHPDIPAVFREVLIPAADILTPNRFELEMLAGFPCNSPEEVRMGAESLLERGPSLVLVTGLAYEPNWIESLAVSAGGVWRVRSPRIDAPAFGAGDTFSAIFLGRLLEQPNVARALELACASVTAILQATRTELALVPAQSAIEAPPSIVRADPV
jgi:pyridoxine kinase